MVPDWGSKDSEEGHRGGALFASWASSGQLLMARKECRTKPLQREDILAAVEYAAGKRTISCCNLREILDRPMGAA